MVLLISATVATALTVAYAGAILKAQTAPANSVDLASMAQLSLITLELTVIAGGATTITWFLARDATGNAPITPEQTDTILDHDTDTDGSVARTIGIDWNKTVLGDIHVFAKTDVGTATATGIMTWTLRSPAVV